MRFAFTDDQEMLATAVKELLVVECSPDVVRSGAPGVWDALAEQGVVDLLVAEDDGGLGLAPIDMVLIQEAAGWVCYSDDRLLELGDGDASVLFASAQLLGLGRRMLDMAVGYAKIRKQFSTPIGSFQAIQHHCTNARLALDFAAPLVYRAAWCLSQETADASVAVSMAKLRAGDAATLAGRISLQVHGAIGYSHEHDLHLWLHRAWRLASHHGDADHHRNRIAKHLELPHA
jgi:alkylation response protein AidB-like acyl-CoA dehydrogenase